MTKHSQTQNAQTPQARTYQIEAQRQVNTLLNATRHPVYLAPCGTGKTYTAAAIIKDRISLGRRVYVLVPQVEIFDEWMRVLSEFGLQPGYVNDEGVRGKDRGVYVCMALSLINYLATLPESIYPDEIITDEMQHSLAASWEKIYAYFNMALRLGLSATLYHGSLRSFEHLYTDVVQTITKSQAIDGGYITKPLLLAPERWAQHVPKNGEEFDLEKQAEILGAPTIIGNVIDFYAKTFSGLPVLVPCSTHEHAENMTAAFNRSGWRFEHLHSKLGKWERKSILRRIAAAKINGICTVGIGIEGMSIHGLYGVLWLRRTASPIIWTQFNGRAERVMPGKEYYVCADFVGNSVLHGMPDRDMVWKIEQERAEIKETEADRPVMRLCPFCGVMNAGINTVCHFCGMALDAEQPGAQSERYPAIVSGKLVVVESDTQVRNIEQHIAEIKEANAAAQETPLREISESEKVDTLHKNLFKGNRRKLFEETVKDWL
jgi:superfamily II DNA or RNA helicase